MPDSRSTADSSARCSATGPDRAWRATGRAGLLALLLGLPTGDVLASPFDLIAPSVPGSPAAIVVAQESITLEWQESTDDRRVRRYIIFYGTKEIGRSKATHFTVSGLQPSTTYRFEIVATDGTNRSAGASVIATTLATEDDAAALERERLATAEAADKTIESNGAPEGWSLAFASEFDGSGDLAIGKPDSLWRFEDMDGTLHRAGNGGMDEHGNTDVKSWTSAAGKRWSAWYDDYQTDNAYRSDGLLVMQGLSSGETDPTRPEPWIEDGETIDFGSSKLYTAWIDTWTRDYDDRIGKHVVDPASPGRAFRYGYFEMRVSFEEMITPGFRLSWWLMPASTDAAGQELVASKAYDDNGDNGVEIDIFEYEYRENKASQLIQLTLLGGAAGDDGMTFDASTIGVDLRKGFHTIGFLWEADRLVWSIDGKVARTITDAALIPDVYSYMALSREMNSGVKRGNGTSRDGDTIADLPFRPGDPGLYAQNIWSYRDRLARDRAKVDYVRVWQPK